MTLDAHGDARAFGAVQLQDEGLKMVLVTDGAAQASCADLDDDGVGGLVRLTVGLRDIHTGASFTGVISPANGEVDGSGRANARFSFEQGQPSDRKFDGWLRVRFFDRQR